MCLMSITSKVADRFPIGDERTRTRLLTVLALVVVLLPALTGMAAAQADTDTDFLCGDNEDSSFSNTMSNLMTVFVVGGPVIGTLVAAYAQVAMAGQPNGDWHQARKKALISGWGVPVLVYLTEILATAVIGIDLSCIVP